MEMGFDPKASTMLCNPVLLLPVCSVCMYIMYICEFVCTFAHTTTGVSQNMWGNEPLDGGLCSEYFSSSKST